MSIEKIFPSGAWQVRALVRGDGMTWYETSTFYFYTKREAIKEFRAGLARSGYMVVK